eukprot:TRINITY_DN2571_c0_g1_i2.p1 TRINITY_DN2571_c0_g1~~TRINITY_DN2571_c0_g1_i2.p1  ORF type:complete len:472 (+),score=97.84 TRINITY_DN2571_c0_g1_i2:60-1475(+)
MKSFNYILIFLLIGLHLHACSYIFDHSTNKTVFIHNVRYIRAANRIKNGTVALLLPTSLDSKLLNTCKKITPYGVLPFTNAALLGQLYGGCDIARHAQLIQDTGARVAILIADTYEVVALYNSGSMKNITIPVLFTGLNQARAMVRVLTVNQRLLKPTLITLTEDENSWIESTEGASFIVFQVFMLITYGLIFVILIRALVLFGMNKDWKSFRLEAGEQILLINLLALIMSILSIVDPFNIRGATNRSYIYVTILLTFPLIVMGMQRLSFFFTEILIKSKLVSRNINYLQYPFIGVAVGSFILFLVFAILISKNDIFSQLLLAANITNIVFLFFSICFYVISGFLMIKAVRAKKSKFMKRVIPIIAVVTFGAILYFIANIIFLVNYQAKLYSTKLFEVTFILFWISICFIVGGQIIFFREPKNAKSKSKTGKSHRNSFNEMKSKKYDEGGKTKDNSEKTNTREPEDNYSQN